mgnify:CR=1 FL=1
MIQIKDYQSERTFIGKIMYTLSMKWSKFLSKHMLLWYILNFTWGLPLTILGGMIALCLLISKHKHTKFKQCIEFDIGNNWGGLEAGFFIFVANNMGYNWTLHTRCHEYGHSFQNALFGPFTIFLVAIPSAIRYWVRCFKEKHNKICKPYDTIWFEGSATDTGIYIYYSLLK